jgi:hypothetical protein
MANRCLGLALALLPALCAAAPSDFFEQRIRPLFVKRCQGCHPIAKLSSAAVVAGNPEASVLYQAVARTHASLQMPPTGKLPDNEIADLAQWIREGAAVPTAPPRGKPSTWAFQPLPPAAPVDIDAHLAKLRNEAKLTATPRADKRTLLRRVTYDLTGLPPTPAELAAFEADRSPQAFAKVVDRLLASPHYGERWARHWLDLARYADGQLGASNDTPYANAYRYRDWVIAALNADRPYNEFARAQIAADANPGHAADLAALGFQALGHGANDQLDVTTRTFLGLTVACAQCHDHKYDPIPTKDYYSLLGVFKSSKSHEYPLADEAIVKAYQDHKKRIDDAKFALDRFVQLQAADLAELLARQTAQYMTAKTADGLDAEVFARWQAYLKNPAKDHPYLENTTPEKFQALVNRIFADRRGMEERNFVKLGGTKGLRDESTRQWTNLESLPILEYYLWRDLASDPYKKDFFSFGGGIYYFGEKEIDRWLSPLWKAEHDRLRRELKELQNTLPAQYPFLHSLKDADKPANAKVAIRGDEQNLGEEAPRRFLSALCENEPSPFTRGSGRAELADAILGHPLAARVIVNRVWQGHFGAGIVASPSNFGQLGERPTHPALLDALAAGFVADGWSLKRLHRRILLSEAYAMSSAYSAANAQIDPENKLLWRANLKPRLDAEALRDSLLAVAGQLDRSAGGPAQPLADNFHRRAIYGYVGRTKPDPSLALFDFPNPNNPAEKRTTTLGPLQRLYFLNNSFVASQAAAFAARLTGDDRAKIHQAHEILYLRAPRAEEVTMGLQFLQQSGGSWPQYAQVLLTATEFTAVN